MKTNHTATVGFTIIKPKGKAERRQRRKLFAPVKTKPIERTVYVAYVPDGHGDYTPKTGTLAYLRPHLKPLDKYRLPNDPPLIHHGKAKR